MDRKTFISKCSMACLAGSAISILFNSCAVTGTISAELEGEYLVVDEEAFFQEKNKQPRTWLVVSNNRLRYPVCLYKHSENEYSALLMQCTHQQSELTVFGDKLYCASHGSEFNNYGAVTTGPAAKPLRSFPVVVENKKIKISLR